MGPYIYGVHIEEGVEVLKLVTCLKILLFLNNRSIFHFPDRAGRRSQSRSFFVDVGNVWPLCLTDKTDPSDPHKREYYLIRTLKTMTPFGLNTEETY